MRWIQESLNACGRSIKRTIIAMIIPFIIVIMWGTVTYGPMIINQEYDYGYAIRKIYITIGNRYDIG